MKTNDASTNSRTRATTPSRIKALSLLLLATVALIVIVRPWPATEVSSSATGTSSAKLKWLAEFNKPVGDGPQLIRPIPRHKPFGTHFVHHRETDICAEIAPVSDDLAIPSQPISTVLLPACPLGSEKCGAMLKGGADDSPPALQSEQAFATGNSIAEDSDASWSMLSSLSRGRIAIKAVKYLLTAFGCDALMEVNPPNDEHQTVRMAAALEHQRDLSVLILGGAFGFKNNSTKGAQFVHLETDFVADIITAELGPDHPIPPRLNLLTLTEGMSTCAYTIGPDIAARMSRMVQQPSSATSCRRDAVPGDLDLSWIPSESFNSVLAFERLRSVPANKICATVNELLRITKAGGAVWVGHIDDVEQVNALSACRVAAGRCGKSTGSADPKATPLRPFSVSLGVLKETFWYRYFLDPTAPLMRKNPLSFVWRKVIDEDLGAISAQGGRKVKALDLSL